MSRHKKKFAAKIIESTTQEKMSLTHHLLIKGSMYILNLSQSYHIKQA